MTDKTKDEYEMMLTNSGDVVWRRVNDDDDDEELEPTWESAEDVPPTVDPADFIED